MVEQPKAMESAPSEPPTSVNRKAIWSLVLGIVGVFPLLVAGSLAAFANWSLVLAIMVVYPPFLVGSIVALVLGVKAKKEIRRAEDRQGGLRMARTGVVLGWVVVGLVVVAVGYFIVVQYGCSERGVTCWIN